jgi:hypothetical protein
MNSRSLDALLSARSAELAKGPLALVLAEDETEIGSTLAHLLQIGFRDVILLAPGEVTIDAAIRSRVHVAAHDVHAEAALPDAVNRVIDQLPGTWIHYCYNAEYLFYPFSKVRNLRELLGFHTEERRTAMMTYVIDLYAGDLNDAPDGVSLSDAWFDRSGYFALNRKDPQRNWEAKDRQVEIFGGLRRRFEEHVAWERRRIDRISLFRAKPGLRLLPDYTLSDPEMNTYACAWHHNLTAAVCSFRAAKALRSNPGSRHAVTAFRWQNSVRFDWTSDQLLALGFIEPGQWF